MVSAELGRNEVMVVVRHWREVMEVTETLVGVTRASAF
jgi:hypothetical protein